MPEDREGRPLVPFLRGKRRVRGDEAADDQLNAEMAELVERLSEEELDEETRKRLLWRFGQLLATSARAAGARGLAGGRWLVDTVVAIAPHIQIRDLETLRAHHRGLSGEQLADRMVRSAQVATAGVGAAGGALATVEFVAPPLLLTAPAQLAAETVIIAVIEIKLIAELHEVYGVQVQGTTARRASVYLQAWAHEHGLHGLDALSPGSAAAALGVAARAALRKRLMRTLGRSLSTMGPFLTGAVAGAALNRMATKRLADRVRKDLRRQTGPRIRAVPDARPAELDPGDDPDDGLSI